MSGTKTVSRPKAATNGAKGKSGKAEKAAIASLGGDATKKTRRSIAELVPVWTRIRDTAQRTVDKYQAKLDRVKAHHAHLLEMAALNSENPEALEKRAAELQAQLLAIKKVRKGQFQLPESFRAALPEPEVEEEA